MWRQSREAIGSACLSSSPPVLGSPACAPTGELLRWYHAWGPASSPDTETGLMGAVAWGWPWRITIKIHSTRMWRIALDKDNYISVSHLICSSKIWPAHSYQEVRSMLLLRRGGIVTALTNMVWRKWYCATCKTRSWKCRLCFVR